MKRFCEIRAEVGGYAHYFNIYKDDINAAERQLEALNDEILSGLEAEYLSAVEDATHDFNTARLGSAYEQGFLEVYTSDDIRQICNLARAGVRKALLGKIKDMNKMIDKIDGKG